MSARPRALRRNGTGARVAAGLAFASLAVAPGGCSRDLPAEGAPAAGVRRLADDAAIETVRIPDVRGTPGEEAHAPFCVLRGPGDWSWFLVANELSAKPLLPMPAGFSPDALRGVGGVTVVEAGLGAAAWLPVEGRAWLQVEAAGRPLAGEDGRLSVAVLEVDRAPAVLGAVVEPGRLRAELAGGGAGPFHPLVPAGDGLRAILRTRTSTRSLLVVARAEGGVDATLERVVVRRRSPVAALSADGALSERLVADVDVDGVRRAALVLPPGAEVVTRPIACAAGSALRAEVALLGSAAPDGGESSLVVTAVPCEGDGAPVEARTALAGPAGWRRWEVALGAEGRRVRLHLRYEAPPGPTAVAVGAPSVVPPAGAGGSGPPHVVLISLDTLRADRVGAYGNTRGLTPHLDRLAAEGVVFENAYANAPYTLPSHVTMFSGLLPAAHGVERYDDRVSPSLPWLPAVLADAGYRTAAFTAGGFVSHEFGFGRGFDLTCEVDPIGDRYTPGHALQDSPFLDGAHGSLPRALAWLSAGGARPSFLFLHTYMAHEFLPPVELAREFGLLDEGDPPLTFEAAGRFDWRRVQEDGLSPADARRMVDAYDATVKACDAMVGEVLAALDAAGLADRTVVVVTSDHGEELLDRGGAGHGVTLHEEVIRVPLLVRVPGGAAGRRVGRPVSLVDLAPSLLERLDLPAPPGMAGRSFAAAFDGGAIEARTIVSAIDLPPRSVRRAVIDNGWKLIVARDDETFLAQPRATRALYHLAEDPGERDDRLRSEPAIVDALLKRLEASERASARRRRALGVDDQEDAGALPADLEARLKELGYLGG